MKKKIISLVAALALLGSTAIASEKEITKDQLVDRARTFISSVFPKDTYVRVMQDDDGDYEVRLSTGHEIDFNSNGEWSSIKSVKGLDLVKLGGKKNMITYLKNQYPNEKAVKMSRDQMIGGLYYEIELTNGLELVFDKDGKFIRIDD